METTPRPPVPEFMVVENDGFTPCVLVQMDATIAIEPKRTANKVSSLNISVNMNLI